MKRFPLWPRPLTTAQQHLSLQNTQLSAGTGMLRRERLRWQFDACPTPLGRTYHLRITYHLGSRPEVFVDDPDLTLLAAGRRLPHVYRQKPTRLCLYLPGTGEWSASMRIVDTIIPWSILWLFYFEDWLETNAWKGGGIHPDENDEPDAADSLD